VPPELQVADFFTKAQTREQHQLHLLKLNASHPPSPPWVWRRVLSMAHMDPPSLPSPSCSPSGNSFHFPCVHANQASSDTNQSSFLLKTPINHRFYFLRTTIIYWYTSIYVVACFLRISIMYIAAIWEIMTTSNHLVSPFFFYGGSNRSYNPYTFHLFYLHINHGTYTVYNGTLSITHYQSQLPIGYLPGLFSLFYRRMPYAPRISKIMVHIDLCNQGLILT